MDCVHHAAAALEKTTRASAPDPIKEETPAPATSAKKSTAPAALATGAEEKEAAEEMEEVVEESELAKMTEQPHAEQKESTPESNLSGRSKNRPSRSCRNSLGKAKTPEKEKSKVSKVSAMFVFVCASVCFCLFSFPITHTLTTIHR